jgi:uncharacterized protein (TIGR02301 family)
MVRGVLGALLILAATAGAAVADRAPADRQTLLDLSYVLGEAHALRQACNREDQTWRSRMKRLVEVESADEAFTARLTERFNAGFLAGQARYPECSPKVAPAEVEVARRGAELSGALARSR